MRNTFLTFILMTVLGSAQAEAASFEGYASNYFIDTPVTYGPQAHLNEAPTLQEVINDNAGRQIELAAGDYLFSNTLILPLGTSLRGEGAGATRLLFDCGSGKKNGIEFADIASVASTSTYSTMANHMESKIEGVSIVAKGGHCRNAIDTTYFDVSQHTPYNYFPRYVMNDLFIHGFTPSGTPGDLYRTLQGWDMGIFLRDSIGSDIRNVRIFGSYDGTKLPSAQTSVQQVGIRLEAEAGGFLRNTTIDNVVMNNLKYFFQFGNNVSSFFVRNCDLNAGYIGLMTLSSATGGLEGMFENMHINVQYRGVQWTKRSWISFDNVYSTRHKNYPLMPSGWEGFYFWDCHHVFLNDVRSYEGDGTNPGDLSVGFRFSNSSDITASGVHVVNVDAAFWLKSVSHANISNILFQGAEHIYREIPIWGFIEGPDLNDILIGTREQAETFAKWYIVNGASRDEVRFLETGSFSSI